MSEKINEIAKALIEVQSEIMDPVKNATNPHFKNDYADLSAILSIVRPVVSKSGIAVVQTMEPCEFGVTIVTTLMHSSGQWVRSRLSMKPGKDTPQAYGSAITYGRRYSLAAILGITQTDDDGNDGSQKQNGNGHKQTKQDGLKDAANQDAVMEKASKDLGGGKEVTGKPFDVLHNYLEMVGGDNGTKKKNKLAIFANKAGIRRPIDDSKLHILDNFTADEQAAIVEANQDDLAVPF